MAAPAAPVVVEGGALAALTGFLLLAVLVWASLFALQKFYSYTLGAVVRGLAGLIDKAVPFYDLGSATVGKIDDGVQVAIGSALSAAERNVSRTWSALAWVVRETGDTLELFAHATVEAFHSLTHGEIPAQIRSNVIPNTVRLGQATAALGASVLGLRATLYAQVGGLEARVARAVAAAQAAAGQLRDVDIPALRDLVDAAGARVGALGRYVHGALDRRIGRLEQAVTGAALAAGVLAVIARYAPWVRCSNVGKVGKAICRTDTGLLDALLLGLTVYAGSQSVVRFANGMLAAEDEMVGVLERLIVELGDAAN